MNSYHGMKIYIHPFLAAHACMHAYIRTYIHTLHTCTLPNTGKADMYKNVI
jgi:hypothetical protein